MLDMLSESGEFLRIANICNLTNIKVLPKKTVTIRNYKPQERAL